jgi:hypothetical protein
MRKEPPVIEGQFRVVGEKPRREPVILSWRNLAIFVASLVGAAAVRTYFLFY